ncbi:MAG: hypothetical protein P8M32_09405 [Phycisphaerales bacterium]|nr:hypothetical protein [Phycisphaerales bacterium]
MNTLTPKRIVLVCIGLAVLVVVVIVALLNFRPVTFASIVESRLAEAIGGDVRIGQMSWLGDYDLSLGEVVVSVPGMSGPAAEVIVIDRMTVKWSGGISAFQIDDVVVHDALVRLIERDSWNLTLADLHPTQSASADSAHSRGVGQPDFEMPRIRLELLRVESGALLGNRVAIKGRAQFVGALAPLQDDSGGMGFSLQEVAGGTAAVNGTYFPGVDQFEATATGISLGLESQQLIPFWAVRHSAAKLDLQGEVGTFTIARMAGQAISASMWLDTVSIRLDPAVLGIGSHFWEMFLDGRILKNADPIPPKLFVESGFVEFRGDEFEISGLEGYIASGERWGASVRVPYRVDLLVAGLNDVAAMHNVDEMAVALEHVPFSLDVSANGVRFEKGHVAVVPADAARILSLFRVQQCDVDMDLSFDRTAGQDEIDVNGRLMLSDGRGAYDKFPYPLHDLNAIIKLVDDDVKVVTLTALGSGESSVQITGRVDAQQGRDLAVRVQAVDVPLDRILVEAMPPRAEATLRDVFSREHINTAASGELTHQIVDLDLLIEQDDDENLSISGVIPFDKLQMTWSEFPLTLLLDSGQLRWGEDMHMEGQDGGPIRMRTAEGGGIGEIRGAILVPLGEGESGGWIEFDVKGEHVDANLLEAILFVSDGDTLALSRGALEGILDANGRVEIDGDEIRHDVKTTIRRGSLQVTPELEDMVGLQLGGPLGDADLLDLEGGVNISNPGIELSQLSVRASGAEILLQGTPRDGGRLHIDATGLHIGRWLLKYFPEPVYGYVFDLWNAWGPWGRFDASMQLGGEVLAPQVTELVGLAMEIEGDQRVSLRDGAVHITGDGVEFQSVLLQLASADFPAIPIEVRGTVSSEQDSMLLIDADRLELATRCLKDILMVFTGVEGERVWKELDPAGEVATQVQWETRDGNRSWHIDLSPRTIEATWRGRRLVFHDQGGSEIQLIPGHVRVGQLIGRVGEASIDVSGTIDTDPMRIDAGGSYVGGLGDDLLVSLAGDGWKNVLDSIELADDDKTRVAPFRVEIDERGGEWDGLIEAQVMLRGAAMTTGMKLKSIDADIFSSIALDASHPTIDLQVARGSAHIRDSVFEDIRGAIQSDPIESAPSRIAIDNLVGELGGGRCVVSGFAGGKDGEWAVDVSVANSRLARLFPGSEKEGEQPSTGEVDASLHLRGRAGASSETTGVGEFRVTQGHLKTLPALVAIQQVLHLSSPVVGAISFVDVDFYILGQQAILEKIVLASGPFGQGGFSLRGDGTLDLETMETHARLNPRGAWPIVRDLIGAVQDQFYEISIDGHVGEPVVDVVALPGFSSN